MPRAPETRVAKLTRVTADGRTLYFTTADIPAPRNRRCRLVFISPENVPEFDGDEAWFTMERVRAIPWAYWRAIGPGEPPAWKR